MLTPRADAGAAARGTAARSVCGRTATRRPPTITVGTSMPSVPAIDSAATRLVITGGPSARPTLPPRENHDNAVAFRAPAAPAADLSPARATRARPGRTPARTPTPAG